MFGKNAGRTLQKIGKSNLNDGGIKRAVGKSNFNEMGGRGGAPDKTQISDKGERIVYLGNTVCTKQRHQIVGLSNTLE